MSQAIFRKLFKTKQTYHWYDTNLVFVWKRYVVLLFLILVSKGEICLKRSSYLGKLHIILEVFVIFSLKIFDGITYLIVELFN